MKKITVLLSMLAAAVWLHGCTDGPEGARNNSPPATIDIASAREAFVRDYTAAIETRSSAQPDQRHYTLADTDFTPLWDLAVASENALIQSLDIPLLATTRCFSSDDGGKSMLQMRQKLVFVRQKGSQRITSYLLSLASDPRCEHIADPDRIFIHAGDKSRFCGIAIYTDLGGRLPVFARRNTIPGLRFDAKNVNASKSHASVNVRAAARTDGSATNANGGCPIIVNCAETACARENAKEINYRMSNQYAMKTTTIFSVLVLLIASCSFAQSNAPHTPKDPRTQPWQIRSDVSGTISRLQRDSRLKFYHNYFISMEEAMRNASSSGHMLDSATLACAVEVHDDGTVTASWGDGSSYSGEVFFGEIRGKGTMIYPDGSRYEGEWEADLPNGEGIFTDSSGTAYAVRWIDGLPHGKGTITQSDGTRYDARWRRGKLRAKSIRPVTDTTYPNP